MNLLWTEIGWEDYIYWQSQDKKTLRRINGLIKEIVTVFQCRIHYGNKQIFDIGKKNSKNVLTGGTISRII